MKNSKNNNSTFNHTGYRELETKELHWNCPTDIFKFKSTAEVEQLNQIVGQPRAIESIKIGASIGAKGYNIFVTGQAGTGRLSTVQNVLQEVPGYSQVLYDYCYVNNFDNADKPILIKLAKGEGRKFAKMMKDAISYLRRSLPRIFEEEEYQNARRKLTEKFQELEKKILDDFDNKLKPHNFIRGQYENEQGITIPDVFPIIDGKPVTMNEIEDLEAQGKITIDEAKRIKDDYQQFHEEIFGLSQQSLKLMQEFRMKMDELNKATSSISINAAFKEIDDHFKNEKIKNYIKSVKININNNLALFLKPNGQQIPLPGIPQDNPISEEEKFAVYTVNVVLDNSKATKPPIIVETFPTYTNLFGTIERTFDSRGFWRTDFTKIKAGSILRADQGYLIVNSEDLFQDPYVWNSLKRVLLYNKLEIQPYDSYLQLTQSYLKPETIDVNVKVIILGDMQIYRILNEYDKTFRKIFKINAQFDYYTNRDQELINNYVQFISKICNEEKLPHFSPEGIGAIIEWAAETAGSQNKLTLRFSALADIVREASYYMDNKAKLVDKNAVEQALQHRRYRSNLIDEKIKEEFIEGTMLISTEGKRSGQINGLTIYNDGIFEFGKPARITATTSAGTQGIVNIEREAELSGNIHNKAVLIISGFLEERFAQNFPLTLTASLAFEQSYGGIDGDSASCAEIYVLLSSISGCPINQELAITGSVNQKGDVQPIGGVNEKIRGFWEICKERGLTGSQGVIIPEQNVKDLMLCKEVIQDVQDGKFHIYAISKIEDAVPLLFGMNAGLMDADKKYPENTLFGKVYKSLERFYEISREKEKEKPKSTPKTKK
ncbi:MAG TPA: ATP-binding protein [Candidatus Kapabacteria bacterium]|mgnify:CR=1 FL=1|jgi:lon-related putative ATP-dependent protease|nr:ATP-binding protein [Candidatus Kapabacteria bacterium]